MKRHLALMTALLLATSANAGTLIGFTDMNPDAGSFGFLSDIHVNWAVGWQQTAHYTNVAISAVIGTHVPGASANWWLTRSLGPGTGFTDVVAQGSYTAPELASELNFNLLPSTQIVTGLDLDAGSYYLVLDGPAGPFQSNAYWIGDFDQAGTMLAPGVSNLSYAYSVTPTPFGPAASFTANSPDQPLIFKVTGTAAGAVPEPANWAMLIAGFGLTGATMRRRRRVPG